jgi:hypothetical protein
MGFLQALARLGIIFIPNLEVDAAEILKSDLDPIFDQRFMKLPQARLIVNFCRFKQQQSVEKVKKHSLDPHVHTLNLVLERKIKGFLRPNLRSQCVCA